MSSRSCVHIVINQDALFIKHNIMSSVITDSDEDDSASLSTGGAVAITLVLTLLLNL